MELGVHAPQNKYIFHGVPTECLENRFIEVSIDRNTGQIEIMEYFLSPQTMHLSREKSISSTFNLPEHLKSERVIGRPVCIGCRDELIIIQYITQSVRYIRFMAIDMAADFVQCFEDTSHFFSRDLSTVKPLRCYISPDKLTVISRLPQDIASPKRWTKIMEMKKSFPKQQLSPNNKFLGTETHQLRDRKFHCFVFLRNNNILSADIEEYCERCRLHIISSDTGKSLLQKVHRIEVRSTVAAVNQEEDFVADDVELPMVEFLQIHQCSVSYNRHGNILVLYCLGLTNSNIGRCKVYFYELQSLENISSKDFIIPTSHFDREINSISMAVAFSPCDTKMQIWIYKCGSSMFTVQKEITLPYVKMGTGTPILKTICRKVILSTYNVKDLITTKILPKSLIDFLLFKTDNNKPTV